MVLNRWKDKVSDKLLNLLEKWTERRICLIHGAYLPTEGTRYIFKRFYNKLDQLCFRTEVIEGIDDSRSTAPRKFTQVDEFGYAFRDLSDYDQIIILSYVDPLRELDDKDSWSSFLKCLNISNNGAYERILTEAMTKLQYICEEKGLVDKMEGELRGWKAIATFLKRSIPTVRRYAEEYDMPVSLIGGDVVIMKDDLYDWWRNILKKNLIHKVEENEKRN